MTFIFAMSYISISTLKVMVCISDKKCLQCFDADGWQRKGIWPVKNWVVRCWHSYLTVAKCRFAYGPADPTATYCILLQDIQIRFSFTFLVSAHLGSPRQNLESCKMVVVVVVLTSSSGSTDDVIMM